MTKKKVIALSCMIALSVCRVRNFLDLHLMMVQRMKGLFFQEYMHFMSRRNL